MLLPLGLAALALGFLMPGHYVPWVSFEQQAVAACGTLLIGVSALRADARIAISALAVAAVALAGLALLQLALGQIAFKSDAAVSGAYLLAFAAAVATGQRLTSRADTQRPLLDGLAWTLFAAALLSALIALVQWQQLRWSIFIVDLRLGDRPYANLAQPNHLASLLCLGIVAGLYLYEARRLSAPTLTLTTALLGWGLVMTQSRTGWLFGALLLLWWAWKHQTARLRLRGTALVASLALFAVGVASWSAVNEALLLSAPQNFESRLQAGTRWIHWPTLWDAAWREPWFGYGWGQVVLAQQAAVLDHPPVGEWLLQSHNLLLDLMIYNGVPIGLTVFGLLVWWFVRHIRACRSVEQWALIAAVGTVFTHALLEYPLDYAYFLLPTGVMMGALEALHPAPAGRLQVPRWAFAAVLTGLAGMLVWITAEYLKVESATRQLRFVMLGIGVDKVPNAPVPDVWLLDQPREFHRYWMTPATPGMSAEQLDWMRRVSMREPRPPAQLRYALAAGLNGRPEEAALTLARLCKMHAAIRCDEGRESWAAAQQQHPVLRSIPYPATPSELR
jgi:O-antigen ligase